MGELGGIGRVGSLGGRTIKCGGRDVRRLPAGELRVARNVRTLMRVPQAEVHIEEVSRMLTVASGIRYPATGIRHPNPDPESYREGGQTPASS